VAPLEAVNLVFIDLGQESDISHQIAIPLLVLALDGQGAIGDSLGQHRKRMRGDSYFEFLSFAEEGPSFSMQVMCI
jgi:hypothetical protein